MELSGGVRNTPTTLSTMATNMATPPRPLNNSELVWESTYLQFCNLYASGKRNEALDLAWECYQDPVIPRILRTTCCKQSSEKPKKCSTWLSKTAKQITREAVADADRADAAAAASSADTVFTARTEQLEVNSVICRIISTQSS